jgi:hypothetical protein
MHVLERRSCSRWHVFVVNTDICEVLRKILFLESGQKGCDFVWDYETWNADISERESTFFIRIVDVYTCYWQGHLGCSVGRCLKFTDCCLTLISSSLYIMSSSGLVPYVDLIIRPENRNRCARRNRSPSPVIETPDISLHKRRKLQKDDILGERLSSKVCKFYYQVTINAEYVSANSDGP